MSWTQLEILREKKTLRQLYAAVGYTSSLRPDVAPLVELWNAFYARPDTSVLRDSGIVPLLLQSLVLNGDS